MKRRMIAGLVVAAVAATAVALVWLRPLGMRSTDAKLEDTRIEPALERIDKAIWGMTPPLDEIALIYKGAAGRKPAPAPSPLLAVAKEVDLRALGRGLDEVWVEVKRRGERGASVVRVVSLRKTCRAESSRFSTVVRDLESWLPERESEGAARDELVERMREYMRAYDALGTLLAE